MSEDRAEVVATNAIALMSEQGVAPSPDNFRLFYNYCAGETQAITRIVGDMLEAKKEFTADILVDLRRRFFDDARLEHAVTKAGAALASTVKAVSERLETAGRDAVAYGKTLTDAHGELDASQSQDELQKLVGSLKAATNEMEVRTKTLEADLQRSSQQVADLKAKLDDVRRESLTDPLTGLSNRKAFDTEMEIAIESAREHGEPLSVFMCDIDRFKVFNDTFGHQTGDHVLRLVSQCLSENVKGRDTAARYGGEEFVVILPQTTLADSVVVANQIRKAVESRKLVKKNSGDVLGTITISIGVAQLGAQDDAASLVQRADACLYGAKHAGRNRVMSETEMSAKVDAA
ncbi:MAG TPA: GGDEF domain-containing protein [Rhizomicrobium sp.]|nr:GGDEF domain-containing protein [Rhizomicrobium sp.]